MVKLYGTILKYYKLKAVRIKNCNYLLISYKRMTLQPSPYILKKLLTPKLNFNNNNLCNNLIVCVCYT